MLFKVQSVIKYYTKILAKSLGIGKEQLSSIFILEIILDLTLCLDKISMTLVLLSFNFTKFQVI